jgi:glutathione S-transferase
MLRVYAHRSNPHSQSVLIALSELDCAYERIELAPGEKLPASLTGKTPGPHAAPVLVVRDDFILWDSAAIIHWLGGSFRRSLTPSQLDTRALALAWVGFATCRVFSAIGSDGGQRLEAMVRDLEPMIPEDGSFLVESTFSIADIALAPALMSLSPKFVKTLSAGTQRYIGAIQERPSVREACATTAPRAAAVG